MVQVIKDHYYSKADSFIFPFTGLPNTKKFNMRSYLFWENYSIEDYNIIITYTYGDYAQFVQYCKTSLFPILDKKGYLLESYDYEDMTVFILDISEWKEDIETFLKGSYSKLSEKAKNTIEEYHTYYVQNDNRVPIHIFSALYPHGRMIKGKLQGKELIGMTPIEYVAKNYGLDLTELQKVGELGSIYDIKAETLTVSNANLIEA